MNWPQITKYLDRTAVDVNTSKAKSRGLARAIGKINYAFTTPYLEFQSLTRTQGYQINYTMPQDFYIVGWLEGSESTTFPSVKCIRYRVGNTVYRYRLPLNQSRSADDTLDASIPFNSLVLAEKYDGQLIKANFCIEYWCFLPHNPSKNRSWTFITSLLTNPSTPDQTSPIIYTTGTQVPRATMVSALPEAIPTSYDTAAQWLTN